MPIPGPHDYKLAAVNDLHALVMLKLGLIHRGQFKHTEDGRILDGAACERMTHQLRETLQLYVDRVMAMANEGANA